MPLTLHTDDVDVNHNEKTGELYVVATPIGNMDDITLRALKVLDHVDLIAAEDTRHTGKLLAYHNIKGRLISLHEHNEANRTPQIVKKLKEGICIALISNAGTPTLSDPGYRLVKAAADNRIKIIPVPGVSAAITALCVSGLPTNTFVFAGFLSKKRAKRLNQLERLKNKPETIIFYESPGRIIRFLKEIIDVAGNRDGVLAREMTKLHEEFIRGKLSHILSILERRQVVKGECTLIIAGSEGNEVFDFNQIESELIEALEKKEKGLKEIAVSIAEKYKMPKNMVYNQALKLQKRF